MKKSTICYSIAGSLVAIPVVYGIIRLFISDWYSTLYSFGVIAFSFVIIGFFVAGSEYELDE